MIFLESRIKGVPCCKNAEWAYAIFFLRWHSGNTPEWHSGKLDFESQFGHRDVSLPEFSEITRPRSRRGGAIRATLTRTPSALSLLRATPAVFPSVFTGTDVKQPLIQRTPAVHTGQQNGVIGQQYVVTPFASQRLSLVQPVREWVRPYRTNLRRIQSLCRYLSTAPVVTNRSSIRLEGFGREIWQTEIKIAGLGIQPRGPLNSSRACYHCEISLCLRYASGILEVYLARKSFRRSQVVVRNSDPGTGKKCVSKLEVGKVELSTLIIWRNRITYCKRGRVDLAARLARSPSTKAKRVQSPAGSPDFRKWESCRTMLLVGGFSRGSPVSPAPSFLRRSILQSPSSTLKTSLLRAAQLHFCTSNILAFVLLLSLDYYWFDMPWAVLNLSETSNDKKTGVEKPASSRREHATVTVLQRVGALSANQRPVTYLPSQIFLMQAGGMEAATCRTQVNHATILALCLPSAPRLKGLWVRSRFAMGPGHAVPQRAGLEPVTERRRNAATYWDYDRGVEMRQTAVRHCADCQNVVRDATVKDKSQTIITKVKKRYEVSNSNTELIFGTFVVMVVREFRIAQVNLRKSYKSATSSLIEKHTRSDVDSRRLASMLKSVNEKSTSLEGPFGAGIYLLRDSKLFVSVTSQMEDTTFETVVEATVYLYAIHKNEHSYFFQRSFEGLKKRKVGVARALHDVDGVVFEATDQSGGLQCLICVELSARLRARRSKPLDTPFPLSPSPCVRYPEIKKQASIPTSSLVSAGCAVLPVIIGRSLPATHSRPYHPPLRSGPTPQCQPTLCPLPLLAIRGGPIPRCQPPSTPSPSKPCLRGSRGQSPICPRFIFFSTDSRWRQMPSYMMSRSWCSLPSPHTPTTNPYIPPPPPNRLEFRETLEFAKSQFYAPQSQPWECLFVFFRGLASLKYLFKDNMPSPLKYSDHVFLVLAPLIHIAGPLNVYPREIWPDSLWFQPYATEVGQQTIVSYSILSGLRFSQDINLETFREGEVKSNCLQQEQILGVGSCCLPVLLLKSKDPNSVDKVTMADGATDLEDVDEVADGAVDTLLDSDNDAITGCNVKTKDVDEVDRSRWLRTTSLRVLTLNCFSANPTSKNGMDWI
ncbi:hypothetical protein PR048_008789 [Dryococelus australis]|uniref:Uncharacterized protein n=1 Tax=Dryococelus australis TaxID=614101 RepID=A0ABQ9HY41_9NEOP|nr:hypothetical protein PR048_008789 [Dryococelus australis]